MTDGYVLVLTTISLDVDPSVLGTRLVEERLAACVNIGAPMTSVYWWQGNLTRDAERQLVIKTTADRVVAVKARLTELHSYELPEIIVIPVVDGSHPYLGWVRTTTAAEPGGG